MGAACCVAAKDRTIMDGSPSESLQRHARYSPSWSYRWDNHGGVAGEETNVTWSHVGGCANDRIEVKYGANIEPVFASEEGSPIDSFRSVVWQKSPISEENGGISRISSSEPFKIVSPSVTSVSSLSASPLSSQSHLPPRSSTSSRWYHQSPGHRLLRQVSDSRIPEYKSPTFSISEEPSIFLPPAWRNESSRGSDGGSSDSWSMPVFSGAMSNFRDRWSFDSEVSGFSRDKLTRSSGCDSGPLCSDLQACGICTKLLTQRSSWGWNSQKIISTNELAVVSVLNCGHVYHAECLESMTPEINKYDPDCPVCTFGEKRAVKMSGKALKAELDSKARKHSRKRVVDCDLNSDIIFNSHKSRSVDERGPKMSSSSSMKSSSAGKPFMQRHFSFGSKTSRSVSENPSTLRRSFFWSRSTKG